MGCVECTASQEPVKAVRCLSDLMSKSAVEYFGAFGSANDWSSSHFASSCILSVWFRCKRRADSLSVCLYVSTLQMYVKQMCIAAETYLKRVVTGDDLLLKIYNSSNSVKVIMQIDGDKDCAMFVPGDFGISWVAFLFTEPAFDLIKPIYPVVILVFAVRPAVMHSPQSKVM